MSLRDAFGRGFTTLRLSVTDRCDLRCTYCMPAQGLEWLPKPELLSFEELERLTGVFASLGVRRLRLTGGEPLLRQGLPALVAKLAALPGIEDLSLTTNGTRLAALAQPLKAAGLQRVTVSLDSLDEARFAAITRTGRLQDVLAGIRAAVAAGLKPIKLNAVVLEQNREDLGALAALTLENDFDVRFIEPMPISAGLASVQAGPDPMQLRKELAARWGGLEPVSTDPHAPARLFRLPGALGRIGFISSVSESFCAACDRLRLGPTGRLQLCLAHPDGVDLRGPLRNGASDGVLERIITEAAWRKPAGHAFKTQAPAAGAAMSRIGG
jgi:GTP 3',8-cyclase